MARQTVNSERMADICAALGSPVRIELLKQLREPKSLREIILRPARKEDDEVPDRVMSQASVRTHLEKLSAIRAIKTQRGMRSGKSVDLYVVNHSRVYTLAEEMRGLALLRPEGTGKDETAILDGTATPSLPGAFLVLVNGVLEGKIFPLNAAGSGDASWTLGRSKDSQVALEYDPFVSLENGRITWVDGQYMLEAKAGTRNGTTCNWVEVEEGEPRPLTSGDVVGVGRSLLVFRLS